MTIRIGLMGLGRIGRQIYRACARGSGSGSGSGSGEGIEVAAISDIGRADMLHNLLLRESRRAPAIGLEGNHLVTEHFRTRVMAADRPEEVPWDAFGVDIVIDATGRYVTRDALAGHLQGGARRVVLSALGHDALDRTVVYGVNEATASAADRIVSAGSGTTDAMALVLHTLGQQFPIAHATMTTVHAYTSDQALQDYAGADYRRSRSAAENIIPNTTRTPAAVAEVLPALAGKLSGYALNVPVQVGSMLDMTIAFEGGGVSPEHVNDAMRAAAEAAPRLIAVTDDPIVSSDVIGSEQSVLFDLQATMGTAGMVKAIAWHETQGHAQRILDVVRLYAGLDAGPDANQQPGEAA